MTKYLWMNAKSLLTNPYLIFWSIFFIEFWVILWAYVLVGSIPRTEESVRSYTALIFGNMVMLSFSGAAISIAESLLHSSRSVRFVTKFTKLSPTKFLSENLLSSIIVFLIIAFIMFISVVLAINARFGMFLLPKQIFGFAFSIVLGVLFMYLLSLFLNLFIVSIRAPKSAYFIAFLPLMLGFLSYSAIWIDFGNAVYASPFNIITSLTYYYFSGIVPPTGNYFVAGGQMLVDVSFAIICMLIWIIVFVALDIFLLRKMRGVGIEEIRVV